MLLKQELMEHLTVCEGTTITDELCYSLNLQVQINTGTWSGPVDGVYTYTRCCHCALY